MFPILEAYGLNGIHTTVEPFGSGLINHTWKVTTPAETFILQKLNQHVFHEPAAIACNLRLLADYLSRQEQEYFFVAPVLSLRGEELVHCEKDGWYRMFPFVAGSHTTDVVHAPQQAYEAARQFGRFTRMLSGIDVSKLQITIPHFHDLSLRYGQFLQALESGNQQRREICHLLIDELRSHENIVLQYEAIRANPAFRLRVTHHDTKISNVLFDGRDKGICVIDLDTVMPGYFISDVGDMMRTYLSPVSEEEKEFSKIVVREDFYKAVVDGYYEEMKDELTEAEKGCFFYAGKFMIYMQALRFLTDHLNDDAYYGARYKGHNLVRAQNQLILLQRLLDKEARLATFC